MYEPEGKNTNRAYVAATPPSTFGVLGCRSGVVLASFKLVSRSCGRVILPTKGTMPQSLSGLSRDIRVPRPAGQEKFTTLWISADRAVEERVRRSVDCFVDQICQLGDRRAREMRLCVSD